MTIHFEVMRLIHNIYLYCQLERSTNEMTLLFFVLLYISLKRNIKCYSMQQFAVLNNCFVFASFTPKRW